METIIKTPEEIKFVTNMNISLANALRRSAGEIPIMAITEADIYKNDSALYDEIIAHRLGLVSLKNQKLKEGETVEMKLKAKCKGEDMLVLAGELGGEVVYSETPIVLLGDGQEIELVARAGVGKGIDHSKFTPGLVYYKHLAKVKISGDGEKHSELAELYPEAFEMYGDKLKVKDATALDLDMEDMEEYPGINIEFDDNLVFAIESWGQISASDIFVEACKALKGNLSEVSKTIK